MKRDITMGFVNEIISDQDKSLYDFGAIKRPRLYAEPIRPHSWTIDRARNIFLVSTRGGDQDHPYEQYFALWWQGDVIPVQLEHRDTGHIKTHVTTSWSLQSLDIPAHIGRTREEILATLKEALSEYKVAGAGVPVVSHDAKFDF